MHGRLYRQEGCQRCISAFNSMHDGICFNASLTRKGRRGKNINWKKVWGEQCSLYTEGPPAEKKSCQAAKTHYGELILNSSMYCRLASRKEPPHLKMLVGGGAGLERISCSGNTAWPYRVKYSFSSPLGFLFLEIHLTARKLDSLETSANSLREQVGRTAGFDPQPAALIQ